MKKTREHADPAFVRGPSVTPAGELTAWLDREASQTPLRLVRLPLILKKEGAGFSLHGAQVGAAAGAVEVYANDAPLGIGLADQATGQCKGRSTCAFWVEAYWRGKQGTSFQVDVVRVVSPIEPTAHGSASHVEIEQKAGDAIPAPAFWDEGLPIPAGARRNDALGGATSLAPGRNYTLRVYDIDDGVDAMTAFYQHHLSGEERAAEGREIRFVTPSGFVRLAPREQGTRITLGFGPR